METQMALDTNVAIISGILCDTPVMRPMKNHKRKLTFTIKNVETFRLADGSPGSHTNYFNMEALGRNADNYLRDLVVNARYQITGYARIDEIDGERVWCIRCFNIQSAD
jgi:single-stranded DNA-binding protein